MQRNFPSPGRRLSLTSKRFHLQVPLKRSVPDKSCSANDKVHSGVNSGHSVEGVAKHRSARLLSQCHKYLGTLALHTEPDKHPNPTTEDVSYYFRLQQTSTISGRGSKWAEDLNLRMLNSSVARAMAETSR